MRRVLSFLYTLVAIFYSLYFLCTTLVVNPELKQTFSGFEFGFWLCAFIAVLASIAIQLVFRAALNNKELYWVVTIVTLCVLVYMLLAYAFDRQVNPYLLTVLLIAEAGYVEFKVKQPDMGSFLRDCFSDIAVAYTLVFLPCNIMQMLQVNLVSKFAFSIFALSSFLMAVHAYYSSGNIRQKKEEKSSNSPSCPLAQK